MGHKQEVARENQARFLAFEENAERAGLPVAGSSWGKKKPRVGRAYPWPSTSGQDEAHSTKAKLHCAMGTSDNKVTICLVHRCLLSGEYGSCEAVSNERFRTSGFEPAES